MRSRKDYGWLEFCRRASVVKDSKSQTLLLIFIGNPVLSTHQPN
jgi:hypothetical protein